MTRARLALGSQGEDRVARWYTDNGYETLARNWRCNDGELDLVVAKRDVIVFCEVKTRSSTRFGSAAEAVTITKQRKIRHLAVEFLSTNRIRSKELRFDVGAVEGASVEIIEGAF